jgi:14-3-3 protein epsilon
MLSISNRFNDLKKKQSNEAKVFFLKMKGDYWRYIAEYATGSEHKTAADGALESYRDA